MALCALAGCIVPAPSGESGPPVGPALASTPNANFGGKVELVRATFRPGRIAPGESVRVSLIFRVVEAISDDYVIFVHLEDGIGRAERRNADHAPMGGARPTRSWRPGELLTDEFTIEAPAGVTQLLNVWVGFWNPVEDKRLRITNAQRVRSDGNDRLLVAQMPVGN